MTTTTQKTTDATPIIPALRSAEAALVKRMGEATKFLDGIACGPLDAAAVKLKQAKENALARIASHREFLEEAMGEVAWAMEKLADEIAEGIESNDADDTPAVIPMRQERFSARLLDGETNGDGHDEPHGDAGGESDPEDYPPFVLARTGKTIDEQPAPECTLDVGEGKESDDQGDQREDEEVEPMTRSNETTAIAGPTPDEVLRRELFAALHAADGAAARWDEMQKAGATDKQLLARIGEEWHGGGGGEGWKVRGGKVPTFSKDGGLILKGKGLAEKVREVMGIGEPKDGA